MKVESRYVPTIGVEVLKFTVTTKQRNFECVLWDTGKNVIFDPTKHYLTLLAAGPEKFGVLRDGY